MWLNHLTHVVVLVLEREREALLAILALEEVYNVPHKLLLLLELIRVVVANDVAYLCLLNRALDAHAVEEALVVLSKLRTLLRRKQGVELARYVDGVNHLVLSHAWVHVTARDLNLGTCSVEVLILKLALHATVHGVCKVGSELLHVEVVDTATNLLVGGEAHTNLAVRELRVCHEPLHSGHNLGNTSLIICAKKRCAVGVNEGVALEERKLGELLNTQPTVVAKADILAVVVLHNVWLDISATHIGSCIHVGDEADDWGVLVALSSWECGHHVAILIHGNLL